MKNIYDKNDLKIIYLDQFAAVGLFESESKEWVRIKELIVTGVKRNKIICPLSLEHYIETSQKEEMKAIDLDTEFYKISGGYAFKSELFITPKLIISLLREEDITLSTYMYDDIFKNILCEKEKFDTFTNAKKQLNEKISEATVLANEIRKTTRNNRIDTKTKQLMISVHKSISVNEFITRLKDLLMNKRIAIRGVPFGSGAIPNWIDQMIFQLTNKYTLTAKEALLLIMEFEKYGFNNIPTLDIRTSLSAIISVLNKNETVNDQIDIMRIATGLPISDLFLTDKQRKAEIVELGLDRKYKTKIYSGTKNDLDELALDLEQIMS